MVRRLFQPPLETGSWRGPEWSWGEVDGFEMYFAGGPDMDCKGKRRFKYFSSATLWMLVPFPEMKVT